MKIEKEAIVERPSFLGDLICTGTPFMKAMSEIMREVQRFQPGDRIKIIVTTHEREDD